MEEYGFAHYAKALINAIKNEDLDNTKKHIFLNMLRDFTRLHIEILKFFRDIEKSHKDSSWGYMIGQPEDWYEISHSCCPEIFRDKTLSYVVYDELVFRKLLRNDGHILKVGDKNYPTKQTTPLADEFLAFIAEQENVSGE